jgi:hypothetical protein
LLATLADLEKRLLSLENFRWRVRNACKQITKKDISELYISETASDCASSKSDGEDMDIKTEVLVEPQNTQSAHPVLEVASVFVWPLLRDWLLQKDGEGNRKLRFSRFLRLTDAKNVRQVLFERNKKAEQKYGSGLTMDQDVPSFQPAVEKLADSVYFLFKTMNDASVLHAQNPNEYNRQLDIVTDLYNVLGSFLAEIRAAKLK